MVGKATPDRGGPRKSPDGVDPKTSGWASKRTRKTQRDGHNSGVKIWSLCSVSSTLSHANPWTTLSNPCNKVRGKNIVKEVFLRLYPASFLPVSSSCVFLRASLLLSRYDTANEYITLVLELLPYMVDGPAHYVGKVGDTQQIVIAKIVFLNKQTNICWFNYELRGFYDFSLRNILSLVNIIYSENKWKSVFPKMRNSKISR